MRHALVLVHRYAGLVLAFFLIVASLTGSIMAFEDEIDALLNPQLFRVESRGPALSPLQLSGRIEQQDVRLRVTYIPIVIAEGRSTRVSVQALVDPATGSRYALGFNQLFADPVSGAILGTRQFGALKLDRQNLIPIIIRLHYSLLIPGSWGLWIFGAAALIWTIDCFIGFYLTLPRGRPFMEKWRPAWGIKRQRLNFDLHRAGGLWVWIVLLILAISSVSLNLYSEVFKPVVSWFSPLTPTPFDTRMANADPAAPAYDLDQAYELAQNAGSAYGIGKPVSGIGHRQERGFYFVLYGRNDGKTESGLGGERLYFDDQSGAVIGSRGIGADSAGDVFTQLQYPLHSGRIAGVAGRAFICLIGVLIVALSVTGLVIWWRKRKIRVTHAERDRAAKGAYASRQSPHPAAGAADEPASA